MPKTTKATLAQINDTKWEQYFKEVNRNEGIIPTDENGQIDDSMEIPNFDQYIEPLSLKCIDILNRTEMKGTFDNEQVVNQVSTIVHGLAEQKYIIQTNNFLKKNSLLNEVFDYLKAEATITMLKNSAKGVFNYVKNRNKA